MGDKYELKAVVKDHNISWLNFHLGLMNIEHNYVYLVDFVSASID